jgi:iron only hydrogenase large subunit-like protein
MELRQKRTQKQRFCLRPAFRLNSRNIDDYKVVVGMMRKLGFDYVIENAIGADVIAKVYEDMINHDFEAPHISSDCPAIVNYISRYHPDLMHYVPPIGSPMVVSARISRYEYGENLRIVFAGPCIAKKQSQKRSMKY